MIYKSLNKDFYYVDSGSTRLSYYLTCEGETIYTGRANNPKGIKINIRKLIEDWLWNDMPDFRPYDGVTVTHPDACKTFNLYNDEGSLLGEYMVFLSYEDLDMPMFTYRGINGNADPRQKLFFCGLSDTAFTLTFDVSNMNFLIGDMGVGWPGGRITIPYTTNYKRNKYYFVEPPGLVIVSSNNGRLVVDVPRNHWGQRTFTIEVRRTYDDVVIATSVITQYEAALEYLTIEALEPGVLMACSADEFNKNGTGWQSFDFYMDGVELQVGDVVMLRATRSDKKIRNCGGITVEGGKFKAYGNPLSLIYGSEGGHFECEVPDTLRFLFSGSTIVDAGDLNLNLALNENCYAGMFANCPYLTVLPELPQTQLATYCYAGMFMNDPLVTRSPELPATTGLAPYCYESMFLGCSNLNYIECYATFTGLSTQYCGNWVAAVGTTGGTFECADSMEGKWRYGESGIPWSWKMGEPLGYTGETGEYDTQYVTLEILSAGTIEFSARFNMDHQTTNNKISTLMYSLNGGDWNLTFKDAYADYVTGYTYDSAITVNQGDIVRLRGYYTSRETFYGQYGYSEAFAYSPSLHGSTAKFNVSGNALSLLYGDDFRSRTVLTGETRAFAHLFEETCVVDARELVIPGGLLSPWAMLDMFFNCQYLTTSPIIPEQTEVSGGTAYVELFCDCVSLTDIVCLYNGDVTGDGFQRWVRNVPANGTFTKKQGTTWISGSGGIPSGWTVVDIP